MSRDRRVAAARDERSPNRSRRRGLATDPGPVRAPNPWRCSDGESRTWQAFLESEALRRRCNVSAEELGALKRVHLLGEAENADDFVYILEILRSALKT